jgi:CheY-like chemotaxis protein
MSPDIRRHVFEPFFTTKPEGAGTGLGLAVVFGIVKQHNGLINVDSTEGEGTVFSIYLPLVPAASITAPRKEGRTIVGGDETILVVEDNAQVLELARLILRGAGYTVLTASNGEEALDQFPRRAKDIDLVLMDVVMPKMGGREVRIQMKRIDPAVRILFTSGYSAAGIHTDFILEEGLDFIQKPFVTDTLRGKIRSILDRSGTLLHQPRAAR